MAFLWGILYWNNKIILGEWDMRLYICLQYIYTRGSICQSVPPGLQKQAGACFTCRLFSSAPDLLNWPSEIEALASACWQFPRDDLHAYQSLRTASESRVKRSVVKNIDSKAKSPGPKPNNASSLTACVSDWPWASYLPAVLQNRITLTPQSSAR